MSSYFYRQLSIRTSLVLVGRASVALFGGHLLVNGRKATLIGTDGICRDD
jgi:hypothetical protein